MRTAVLYLTSNASKNWQSDFLSLVLFTVAYWIGVIGLLLVPLYGVDTIAASRMALYCCWLLHFPERFYNLLMFSRHLFLYIELLLTDLLTPMVTIRCFIRSEYNNPLIMTHFCSNYSISGIKSINLVNALGLAHCAAWEIFPSIWKLGYYFQGGGGFWLGLWVVLLFLYCSNSDPKKTWALGPVTLWLYFRVLQMTGRRHQQRYL